MPKDNEVDEKVMPFAYTGQDELDAIAAGFSTACTFGTYSELQDRTVPLYSAATVAELRAEVERLRAALHIETHKVITCGVAAVHPDASLSRRMEYAGKWDSPQAQGVRKLRDRADAAERRVGELRHALVEVTASLAWLAHGECRSIHDGPIMPSDKAVQFSRAALTGADPT